MLRKACGLMGFCGLLVVLTGCSGNANSDTRKQGQAPAPKVVVDQWYLITMQGKKIGHGHLIVEESQDEEKRFRNRYEAELKISRGGTVSVQKLSTETLTSDEGQLIVVKSSMNAGAQGMVKVEGRVKNAQLLVDATTEAPGVPPRSDASKMVWKKKLGGFESEERQFREQPMKPGEKRVIVSFDATTISLSEAYYEAHTWEKVALPDASHEALRITKTVKMGEGPSQTLIKGFVWCDRQGRVLKERMLGSGFEQFATSKEAALAPFDATKLDLTSALQVRTKKIVNAHQTQSAQYRVVVSDEKAAPFFATCGSQLVEADGDAAKLFVRAVRPQTSVDPKLVRKPESHDLAPNGLIQSDAPAIVEMAKSVAPQTRDAWTLALALEGHVHQLIRKKNFSNAFATAAEVAIQREGDCTEHAVLLAALCRARQLPARVVFGLVYYQDARTGEPGFAYHMWNEAFIGDKWIPLDATLGKGGIGAAHIKLSDSNLAGASALSAFLPVAQLANRLQIEVLDVK